MRLIDADVAKKAVHEEFDECLVWDESGEHTANVIEEILEALPTVEAEPVTRCKDCKHWLPHTQFGYDADYEEYHNYCKRHLPDDDFYAFIKEAEDYCSWAERKEK